MTKPDIVARRIGSEGQPIAIVDGFHPDPDALRAAAMAAAFEPGRHHYPGIRAALPANYFALVRPALVVVSSGPAAVTVPAAGDSAGAAASKAATPARMIRAEVGPSGVSKGGTFVLDEQREAFDVAKDKQVIVLGDSDFQIDQVRDVLYNKLTKQKVDIRFMDLGKVEKIGGDKVKQVIKIKAGIEAELAKQITKLIKDSKLKVNASIQGDEVRVQGTKRDELQAAMALIKKELTDAPLSFDNFRD